MALPLARKIALRRSITASRNRRIFSRCREVAVITLIVPFRRAGFLVRFAFRTAGRAFRSQRKRLAFKNRYVSFL